MGMGASSQPRKHPRSLVAGLAFNKLAEKIIYWQIKIRQSCFPAGMGGTSSRCHPAPCQNVPEKQDEKGVPLLAAAS